MMISLSLNFTSFDNEETILIMNLSYFFEYECKKYLKIWMVLEVRV